MNYQEYLKHTGKTDIEWQIFMHTGFILDMTKNMKYFELKESTVVNANLGLFAKKSFKIGEILGESYNPYLRTKYALGRFLNHSERPNVIKIVKSLRVYVKAIKEIQEGEEILIDYCKCYDDIYKQFNK